MDGSTDAPHIDAATKGWLTRSIRALCPKLRCHFFQSMQRDVSQRVPILVKSELPTFIYVPRDVLLSRSLPGLREILVQAGWAFRKKPLI